MRLRGPTHHGVALRWTRVAILGSVIGFLPGCYTYSRIPLDAAPQGQSVRLVVAADGAPDLASIVDTDAPAPVITGAVEGRQDGALLLRVPLRRSPASGASLLEIGQIVRVPLDVILQTERQDFSYARTGLLAAGAAAAATLIVLQIVDVGPGDPLEPNPDPDVLFHLLRIPIG